VPQDDQDELDYLFSELQASEEEAKGAGPRTVRRGRKAVPAAIGTGRRDTGFNPFTLALKMGYAAAIIIVLIFVTKTAYNYWTSPDRRLPAAERQAARNKKADADDRSRDERKSGKRGLLGAKLSKKTGGIYVSSVPSGALVRVRSVDGQSSSEIFRDPKAQRCTSNSVMELSSGKYEVAVAVKVNDSTLRKYPGYRELRRQLDAGAPKTVLDAYFLPDGAEGVTTVVLPNRPMLLVRNYKCEVIGKEWTPLTSLFLPDRPLSEVIRFLPRKKSYGFDDADVEWELDYYGVPQSERKYIIDALHRVGMVMYRVPNESVYRCFVIQTDGSVTARPYSDPRESRIGGGGAAAPPKGGSSGPPP
jgi:hypothetical protein